jgi:hypothetical protein
MASGEVYARATAPTHKWVGYAHKGSLRSLSRLWLSPRRRLCVYQPEH